MPTITRLALWIIILASVLLASPPHPTHSSGGLFSPTSTPAIHESFSTYHIDPITGYTTVSVRQGVRLHGPSAWWLVPVQGTVESWNLEYPYVASAYMQIVAPPNPCAELLTRYGVGHGEFYAVEFSQEASLVDGSAILGWADGVGLDDLADLLQPYATDDWTFLVDEVTLAYDYDQDELFGLNANITYLPSSDEIHVPTDLFAASYTDDRPTGFNNPVTPGRISVHIVATDFYAPSDVLGWVEPYHDQAHWPHALNEANELTPSEAFYDLQAEAIRNSPLMWVSAYRGQTGHSWLQDDLRAAFARGEIEEEITLQSSIYEQRIYPDGINAAPIFSRQPDAPRYDTFDVTGYDPAQYYGCSTRTLDAGEPLRELDVVPFATLAPDLPPQREYIEQFGVEVFVPDGWVRSDVEMQGLPVTLFASEAVSAADVAAYLAGESAPSMLAVYPGPLTFDDPANYFPPQQTDLDLSAYRTMVNLPTSSQYRFNPDAPEAPSVHLAWLISPDDDEQQRTMYDAVLAAAHLRRYASHPDLLHTLYLKPDYGTREGASTLGDILLFQIGQPEGYIESIQLDPLVVTFTNPETGSTIEVALSAGDDCGVDEITPNATARLGYVVVRDGLRVTITTLDGTIDDALLLAMAESVRADMQACSS